MSERTPLPPEEMRCTGERMHKKKAPAKKDEDEDEDEDEDAQ